jgi:lipoprotein-releasing system permease protein
MNNWGIRRVFLINAAYLIVRGLIWGNIIALTLCLIQHYTGIISLNPETYYMTSVPVNVDIVNIVFINLGTVAVCLLVLILPTYVVTRVSPIKAIRFS